MKLNIHTKLSYEAQKPCFWVGAVMVRCYSFFSPFFCRTFVITNDFKPYEQIYRLNKRKPLGEIFSNSIGFCANTVLGKKFRY